MMQLTIETLTRIIKEEISSLLKENENINFPLDRKEWLKVKRMAKRTGEEEQKLLTMSLPNYHIINPTDGSAIQKMTKTRNPQTVVLLGRTQDYLWFKTGDDKYGSAYIG